MKIFLPIGAAAIFAVSCALFPATRPLAQPLVSPRPSAGLPIGQQDAAGFHQASEAASAGQEEQSSSLLRRLLSHPLAPDLERQARRLLMRDQRALFQYRAALDAIAPLLAAESGTSDLQNRARLLQAIADVPPETVSGSGLQLSSASVTGTIGGTRLPFVIDTGASFSVLTRSAVAAAHLTIRPARYAIQSADGVSLRADVAAGDLTVGKTGWRNVVFLVVPDRSLPSRRRVRSFGLIGLPELRRNGTVQFTATAKRMDRSETALRLDDGQLVLDVMFGGETLRCGLDSGANRSVLYAGFWNRFGRRLAPVRQRMAVRTMAGSASALYQTRITISVAGREVRLPRAVLYRRRANGSRSCVLGADAIAALATVTLDFNTMTLKAE